VFDFMASCILCILDEVSARLLLAVGGFQGFQS
jgi:hypothetical protein